MQFNADNYLLAIQQSLEEESIQFLLEHQMVHLIW